MKLWAKIGAWYRGTYDPGEYDPTRGVVIRPGRRDRPALAKLLDVLGHFWLEHWKWIIPTGIATAAAFSKFF